MFSADDNNDEMRDDDTGDAKQTHVAVKVHVPQTYESGEQIFRRNQARKKLLAVLALQVQLYSTVDILSLTLLKFLHSSTNLFCSERLARPLCAHVSWIDLRSNC